MVEERYILPADVAIILEPAGEHYDFQASRGPATQAADDWKTDIDLSPGETSMFGCYLGFFGTC